MDLPAVYDRVSADTLRKLVAGIPAGRPGNADFVADVAVLLAAGHAWFTTGACRDVNGGLFMR